MKTTFKGPRGRLFFGSAADFKRDQLGFYVSCAREYGDWVETWLGPFRMWLVYHPDAIEEILVTQSRDFEKSSGLLRLRPLGGNGLFLAEGDRWLRQRRLLQPAFHRQRLAGYGEVMVASARRHTAEAMRLYPPAYGLGRQAVKPTEIAGHPVAKGDILI